MHVTKIYIVYINIFDIIIPTTGYGKKLQIIKLTLFLKQLSTYSLYELQTFLGQHSISHHHNEPVQKGLIKATVPPIST